MSLNSSSFNNTNITNNSSLYEETPSFIITTPTQNQHSKGVERMERIEYDKNLLPNYYFNNNKKLSILTPTPEADKIRSKIGNLNNNVGSNLNISNLYDSQIFNNKDKYGGNINGFNDFGSFHNNQNKPNINQPTTIPTLDNQYSHNNQTFQPFPQTNYFSNNLTSLNNLNGNNNNQSSINQPAREYQSKYPINLNIDKTNTNNNTTANNTYNPYSYHVPYQPPFNPYTVPTTSQPLFTNSHPLSFNNHILNTNVNSNTNNNDNQIKYNVVRLEDYLSRSFNALK